MIHPRTLRAPPVVGCSAASQPRLTTAEGQAEYGLEQSSRDQQAHTDSRCGRHRLEQDTHAATSANI